MSAAVAVLPSIDLDELTARAALLTRIDRKYVLPAGEVPRLLSRLTGLVRVLDVDGCREFAYRSRYFDTPDLASYRDAARRRPHRFKVRIRSYLDSAEHVLEVKTRDGRGATVKQRVAQLANGRWLDLEARAAAGATLAGAGFRTDPRRLDVALTTRYRRTTLFVPATGSRVTVDTSLEWVLPDGSSVDLPGAAVVETKCASATASPVDRLLWSLHRRPCAISKYATGLAALRPDLPANHWRPVLRRHFATSTGGR